MNDLFWQFGTGYGVLGKDTADQWCGISSGFWNFYFNSPPAFTFSSDSNTGMYLQSNGTQIIFK